MSDGNNWVNGEEEFPKKQVSQGNNQEKREVKIP